MRIHILIVCSFFLSVSCANQRDHKHSQIEKVTDTTLSNSNDSSYYRFSKDSVEIPPFQVELSLSENAEAKLKEGNETIIVRTFLTGQPKDTTTRDFQEHGEIFIASFEIELFEGRLAEFEGVKFSKKEYNLLSNKNVAITVNVFTGRRFYKDNLLDVSAVFDSASTIKDKKFSLKGKLIFGDD